MIGYIYVSLFSEQVLNHACSATLQIRLLCGSRVCPERMRTRNVFPAKVYAFFLQLASQAIELDAPDLYLSPSHSFYMILITEGGCHVVEQL